MARRTVLITGVNGGIGSALARTFHDAGWAVTGVDRHGESNSHCDNFVIADVSSPDSARTVLDAFKAKHKSLDCLINSAAVLVDKPLMETSEEEWRQVFGTNVDAVYRLVRSFVGLLDGASVINISSVHARATSEGLAAYAASKGAVSALTRAMALELAPKGIRVNAVLPGAIDTPMLAKGLGRNRDADEARKALIQSTPLRKIGSPDDVANLALFLADNALAGNITGQEFVCDGGVLARLSTE